MKRNALIKKKKRKAKAKAEQKRRRTQSNRSPSHQDVPSTHESQMDISETSESPTYTHDTRTVVSSTADHDDEEMIRFEDMPIGDYLESRRYYQETSDEDDGGANPRVRGTDQWQHVSAERNEEMIRHVETILGGKIRGRSGTTSKESKRFDKPVDHQSGKVLNQHPMRRLVNYEDEDIALNEQGEAEPAFITPPSTFDISNRMNVDGEEGVNDLEGETTNLEIDEEEFFKLYPVDRKKRIGGELFRVMKESHMDHLLDLSFVRHCAMKWMSMFYKDVEKREYVSLFVWICIIFETCGHLMQMYYDDSTQICSFTISMRDFEPGEEDELLEARSSEPVYEIPKSEFRGYTSDFLRLHIDFQIDDNCVSKASGTTFSTFQRNEDTLRKDVEQHLAPVRQKLKEIKMDQSLKIQDVRGDLEEILMQEEETRNFLKKREINEQFQIYKYYKDVFGEIRAKFLDAYFYWR